MIIVEGPDGSGKDTLINYLLELPQTGPLLERGPRAVKSSTEGAVDNLGKWVKNDYLSWRDQRKCRVYNRHPVISEMIYGPIIRGGFQPDFLSAYNWVMPHIAREAMVVLCLPPLKEVRKKVSADRDMPGVVEQIDLIYSEYASLSREWPGFLINYDYTRSNPDRVAIPVIGYLYAEFLRKEGRYYHA